MFCPQCEAEYLPHVRRCSDCDVPLVEHLPLTQDDSDHEKVSAIAVLKELGPIIAIPFVGVGTALLFGVALRDNRWAIQIVTPIPHTYAVFLFVFCDTGSRGGRDLKGYSLREKAVRQRLPLLFYIHAGFLAVVFGVETSVIFGRTHLSHFWGARDVDFDSIVLLTGLLICFAILFTQIVISRRILGRALKDEQSSSRS
jgi:hypothetical protein